MTNENTQKSKHSVRNNCRKDNNIFPEAVSQDENKGNGSQIRNLVSESALKAGKKRIDKLNGVEKKEKFPEKKEKFPEKKEMQEKSKNSLFKDFLDFLF